MLDKFLLGYTQLSTGNTIQCIVMSEYVYKTYPLSARAKRCEGKKFQRHSRQIPERWESYGGQAEDTVVNIYSVPGR